MKSTFFQVFLFILLPDDKGLTQLKTSVIRLKNMKNIYIYISLTISLFSNLNSQILNGYGLKAGLSSANQLFDYSDNFILDDKTYDYRFGVYFGLFTELFEEPHFSCVIDLSYNQKGMVNEMIINRLDTTVLGYSSEKKILDNRLDYITIGANLKTRYEFKYFSPYVLTGARYDILIGKKIDKLFKEDNLYQTQYYSFWDKYKGNLFGLAFGAGIEITNLLCLPILIEWVYNYDLSNVRINKNLEIYNLSNELKFGIKF